MKNLILIVSLLIVSAGAQAASVYSLQTMRCEGLLYGHAPQLLQDRVVLMAKMDPGAVVVAAQYFALDQDTTFTSPTETWRVGALYTEGRDVFRRLFSEGKGSLHLKIVDSVQRDGEREDRLEGTWFFKNASGGGYGYHLRCVAR